MAFYALNPPNPPLSRHHAVFYETRVDKVDKGVAGLMTKAGHGGQSAGTTEKISDGIRSGFKKMTGKVSSLLVHLSRRSF